MDSSIPKMASRFSPRSRRIWLGLAFVLVILAIALALASTMNGAARSSPGAAPAEPLVTGSTAPSPGYVGAATCKSCHERAYRDWLGSNHELAMQEASEATVLADFTDVVFEHEGETSRFFRRDGKFFVETKSADREPEEFEIRYTFGVDPLQQYLVAFPGGRFQALSTAWDSRPAAAGGQRWFHLYQNESVAPGDQLHWQGRYQNWNLMCAECHSTGLDKGYDASTDTYRTTFHEINVACEACHGPGSLHVAWAMLPVMERGAAADPSRYEQLSSSWQSAWIPAAPGQRFARRDHPAPAAVNNSCAPCHARRSTYNQIADPGAPLEESYRLALLEEPNYFHDGQQQDEVYTWGSFLQSRMHEAGVTCMDCHDAHTTKTRAPGNALCARCHDPSIFDAATHHFHVLGSSGAQCVSCHMPARKYMVIHDRLDHSLRVPRPDLTESIGTPNACTECHGDQPPSWAAAAMDRWFGVAWRERREFATTFWQASTMGSLTLPALLEIAVSPEHPAIVRATATQLAAPMMSSEYAREAQLLFFDEAPMVRVAALEMLQSEASRMLLKAALPLLSDPIRGVRIEAARQIAGSSMALPPGATLDAFLRAESEYRAALGRNADWPAERVNLGNFEAQLGRTDEAIAAFERAIALDASFIGTYVNLADLLRVVDDDARGESVLRGGLAIHPQEPDLHHSLGLVLIRLGAAAAGKSELAEAARLAPNDARYAYVHAMAVHDDGDIDGAISLLRANAKLHPFEPDTLHALVSLLIAEFDRGDPGARDEALIYAERLAEITPGDASLQSLIESLKSGR